MTETAEFNDTNLLALSASFLQNVTVQWPKSSDTSTEYTCSGPDASSGNFSGTTYTKSWRTVI